MPLRLMLDVLEKRECPSVTSCPVVNLSVVPTRSPEGISGEPRSIRLQYTASFILSLSRIAKLCCVKGQGKSRLKLDPSLFHLELFFVRIQSTLIPTVSV
jgi:hypothetical protein